MTTRERFLSIGILGVLVLIAVIFLFHQFYLAPLHERETSIQAAREELATKHEQIRQAQGDLPRLRRWRQLSLPPEVDLAWREYEKYLSELLRQSGFEASVTPKPPDSRTSPTLTNKKPVYTRLTFTVLGHATLDNLVTMLDKFYHTGLLHQVKNLSVQRPLTPNSPQRPNDLDITMTVEALIINGIGHRSYLLPNIDQRLLAIDVAAGLQGGPAGLGLAAWAAGPTGPLGPAALAQPARNYVAIPHKNIFLGPPPPKERSSEEVEISKFVFLTDITAVDAKYEAFLYDRYNNRKTRLRNSPGFDSFKVTDGEGATVVHGKIVRIDLREVVFKAEEKYYVMHVGQNIKEAMWKSYAHLESLTKETTGR